mgnify:CR=1 FL=1
MNYSIGQVFVGEFPEEAAVWCNEGNIAHIEETTPEGSEVREFSIVANEPEPELQTVRTFSKFGIWVATRSMPISEGAETTVWEAFETFLRQNELETGWNQLVDLVEDNPFFKDFYPKAVEFFGKELVDNILAVSVTAVKKVPIKE